MAGGAGASDAHCSLAGDAQGNHAVIQADQAIEVQYMHLQLQLSLAALQGTFGRVQPAHHTICNVVQVCAACCCVLCAVAAAGLCMHQWHVF